MSEGATDRPASTAGDAGASPTAASTADNAGASPTATSTADNAGSSPTPTTVLPPQHWAQIGQVDEEENNADADSALEDDNASSMASITSSILDYRTLHGRTYHSEQGNAQYWGTNDEPQKEMMDITHHILTRGIGDKLHRAPLDKDKVQQVIDIGTGTGTWAIDFADEYPGAEVIGTDISPIQPSWVPPNVQFLIENCNEEWGFKSDFADFIHMRWLFGSVQDWNALCSEAFRVCKPGAWYESLESSTIISSDDGTIKEDSAMGQWGKLFIEGSKKLGSSVTVVEDGTQKKAMEEAGFVNVQEFDFKNPIGTWPKDPVLKDMGAYSKYGLETDSEGFIMFMAHTLGWSREEILVYIAHFRREIRSGKHHGYFRNKVVWGQKPAAASA